MTSAARSTVASVSTYRIEPEIHALVEDARYWIQHAVFPPDEIALRFHHKLTWIHAFPNGNGRHARLAADLLVVSLGQKPFTWGRVSLVETSELRDRYVSALRAADNHDLAPLIAFARS